MLVSGEKGGNQAKLLAVAGLIGGIYDFVVGTFGLWTDAVSTRICTWGQVAADKFKVVFGLNTSAAVLGLGYIVGLKYAMIITAGSCLVWFVIVPVVGSLAEAIDPATMASLLGVTSEKLLADPSSLFTAENLFAYIGKPVGIGGIAMAASSASCASRRSSARPSASPSRSSEAARRPSPRPNARSRTIPDEAHPLDPDRRAHLRLRLLPLRAARRLGTVVTAILIVFVIAFLFTTVAAQRHRHRGHEPRFGHDAHDADPRLAGAGERRG